GVGARILISEEVGAVGYEDAPAGCIRRRSRPRIVARGLVVVRESVELDQDLALLGGLDPQLQAGGVLLLVGDRPSDSVPDIAVVMRGREGRAGGDRVGDRSADRAFRID